ncbi:MAG: LPS export ABC transporter permease LptF [Desulfuromonadales bacterium]|nr:LPS export ABC transporter permease LptF [Desulfuromonadales bacterium]
MSTYRIHRYLLQETAIPAGLGLLIFTFVLFMGRILKLAEMVINKGVPLAEIGRLFALLLPAFLVITIPLAFLLGVLLGFSRLSADSEIVALKASGFSLYGMLKPVLALGLVASLATAFLTLYAEPAGNAAFRQQVFQIAASRANIGILPRVFNDEFTGLVIYANDVDERSSRMQGVMISDERVGSTPSVILAQSGRIISDAEALTLTLRLENGTIHRRPLEAARESYQQVDFRIYDVNLHLGQQATAQEQRPKKAKEMLTGELLGRLGTVDEAGERRALQIELHQRLTLPLAPLLFALVGVPLGIQSQRSGKGGGFALGLAVFLVYYLLFSLAETVATKTAVPAIVSLWLPNLLFLLGGSHLLVRTAQERPFWLPEALGRLWRRWLSRGLPGRWR